jgi:hypothetical protein
MRAVALTLTFVSAGFLLSCSDGTDSSTPPPTTSSPSSPSSSSPSSPSAPRANQAPGVITVEVFPKTPILVASTAVSFAATVKDPDGDPLTFNWDFQEEEVKNVGGGVTHTFGRGGEFKVTVVASDGKGGTSQAQVVVNVRTLQGTWALVSPVGQNMTTNISNNGRSFSGSFSDGKHSFTGNVNDGNRVFMKVEDGGEFYCLTGGNYNGTINDSLDYMEMSRGPGCYSFGLRRM